MDRFKELGLTVWTAAAGANAKEASLGAGAAFIGTLGSVLGGWDKPLIFLLALMAADYVTGVLGAIRTKTLNSEVMFWGGIRKITILFVIGLAALIDSWIQPGSLLFRTIAIFFYAGREGLSVVENLGVYGVDLPPKLVAFLEQLNEKGKEVDNHDKRN
ncbi:holin family protein [Paenibacillus alvei]|uniref:phage holin family protein n=1 Tax=Paenibacillus alvei TaxID=44250 RepID=UPI0018CE11AE|nr:phage holin family protein [Paenibacillus alvei]MBG9737080.1 holin [Paenibacillus alvei]MBG9742810.1 holin [Paenibacillus alvei]MBG9746173.1 holin [Paenibacillus alvei]MCY9579719.1 phage holin family protein [Paenibacillus alvei]MCY9586372.1 phage holin family protein [Paenibacillus alvei]